jgi:hypothetical protein
MFIYILSWFRSVTIDGVWISEFDLLTTCIHHSELQVITAPLLISTIHISLQYPQSHFPACCAFISRFLATASNSGESSATRAHVVTGRRTTELFSTIEPCLLSLPSGARLYWQPSTDSLTHSPTNHFTSTSFHSTELINLIVFKMTSRRGPHRKHRSSIVGCVFVSAGTCLPSLCLEKGCITALFCCCVRVCCGLYLETAPVYRETA